MTRATLVPWELDGCDDVGGFGGDLGLGGDGVPGDGDLHHAAGVDIMGLQEVGDHGDDRLGFGLVARPAPHLGGSHGGR